MSENRIVVSVLGADRPGIVSNVANVLAQGGANIVDISQTILDGVFTMTMIVDLDETTLPFADLHDTFDALAQELGVQITVQREEIFKYMYRL